MTIADRQYGGRAVSERKAERRQRFLDAAIRTFAERGYADCSLADVCTAAGLSKRQFYEEFQTREDVLIASYDYIQDQSAAVVGQAVAALGPDTDIAAGLTAVLTAFIGSISSDPYRAKVAFVEVVGVSERMEKHRRERRHAWAAAIEALLISIAGPDIRVRGGITWAASALIGAINGVAHEWILADPRPPITQLVEVLAPIANSLIITEE
ncbi:TetR/AcrR family transcriptional regulator [Nocardia vinacea]|uniref:TetR/AcrR family transcriptional regulator n=1 Tax=Nocardia vinacea TaxID=96468 RepID=UPI00030B8A79|nr:TetR/AcrR family transcriptional regulator [Nocardia vinacea]